MSLGLNVPNEVLNLIPQPSFDSGSSSWVWVFPQQNTKFTSSLVESGAWNPQLKQSSYGCPFLLDKDCMDLSLVLFISSDG